MPIKITDHIDVISSGDSYPTHKSILGLGGFKSVNSIIERDNIPANRQEVGMWVNVVGDSMYERSETGWFAVTSLNSYEEPSFSTFSFPVTTPIEVGGSISSGSYLFTWETLNSNNISGNVINIEDVSNSLVVASGATNNGSGLFSISESTRNTTGTNVWRISALNTENEVFYRDFEVDWNLRIFYGDSSSSNLLEAGIESLTSFLADSPSANYVFPSSGYKYISYPTGMGEEDTFLDSDTDINVVMEAPYVVNITNSFGVSNDYYSYRSTNNLGVGINISIVDNTCSEECEETCAIVTLESQFPDAEPDDAIRWNSNTGVFLTRSETLVIDNMPGSDFNEKWNNAMQRASVYDTINDMILPGGDIELKDTLVFAEPGIPSAYGQLLRGVTIRGGRRTRLVWDESVAANSEKYMILVPGTNNITLENLRLENIKLSAPSVAVEGLRGIRHRAAYEYTRNTARRMRFERLLVERFSVGAYIGSPAGDDLTVTTWENCNFSNCDTAIIAEGANLANYMFHNLQLGALYSDDFTAGVRLKYSPPKFFDNDPANHQYLDSWGNPVDVYWTTTEAWLDRLRDSMGRDGNDVAFDSGTARTFGGGADVDFHRMAINLPSTGVPSPAFILESSPIKVYDLRLEGDEGVVAIITGVPLTPGDDVISQGQSRNGCIFSDIYSHGSTYPPYDIETSLSGDRNAGYPVTIRGGYYKNTGIPPETLSFLHQLVSHEGMIRGPGGVIS